MGAGNGRMCSSVFGDDAGGKAGHRGAGEAGGAARRAPEERAEEKQKEVQLKPLYKRCFLGYDYDGDSRLSLEEFGKFYVHVLQVSSGRLPTGWPLHRRARAARR